MSSQSQIIHWNCRGLKANRPQIDLLLARHGPKILCLQETLLSDASTFKDHQFYHTCGTIDREGRPHGGVAILVNNSVPQSEIHLKTNLQATAVRVTLHKVISVCSIYLPPSKSIDQTDLNSLFAQIPPPCILVGDFNAHNTLWGGGRIDCRGKMVEAFLNHNNLSLWNSGEHTYMHPGTGSFTAIDISICHPSLLLDYAWEVEEDLCGSDHYPVILKKDVPPERLFPKWKLHKADWHRFQELCEERLNRTILDEDDPLGHFTNVLYEISTETIPTSTTVPKHRSKPWYNKECKEATQDSKRALRMFKQNPNDHLQQQFQIKRAKARRVIRIEKRKSWRNFVSKLTTQTPIKKCWEMIRKIKGKNGGPLFHHLEKDGKKLTDPKEIVTALGETFKNNSSAGNYSTKFQKNRQKKERKRLKFLSENLEKYNKLFAIEELLSALKQSNNTATGSDKIHYEILKNIPVACLNTVLDIFNIIWETGNFPPSWREAIVIPIPKPRKDHKDSNNYRPIALTSCICKTMERMINARLVWFLEKSGLLTRFQSGFRSTRSTTDNLVRLESLVREAFIKGEHMVAIFFDLEKAYDTTWKYGVMSDLHELGLRGRLPLFIKNFLTDRTFKVKLGSTISEPFEQEMGVPQGSILSVTLFAIKINSIVKALTPNVECSLYVDDFVICYGAKSMFTIERKLQHTLNKLQDWADNNGFKFSKSKTTCMHFCQKRKSHADPELYLEEHKIPVVEKTKFLGVLFDRKLSFLPHIKELKLRCQKALDLLRVIAHTDWGADRTVLLRLYHSLIRSKLDYGCIIYGSARKSYTKILDPIQNQALRLCLGAFRSSPIDSLEVEANEPPLELRREQLSLQYMSRMAANPENPVYDNIFNAKLADKFDEHPNVIKTFGLRQEMHIEPSSIVNFRFPNTPPWTYNKPKVILSLSKHQKDSTNSDIYQSYYNEIRSNFPNHTPIYTDGSKIGNSVACAVVTPNGTHSKRLPDGCSIYTAEIHALYLALRVAEISEGHKFMLFTDSLSSLQAIDSTNWKDPLVQKVLETYHYIYTEKHKEVLLCWIPGHAGIRGNESADRAAKQALSGEMTELQMPYTDMKPRIKDHLKVKWKDKWDKAVNNKLHSIHPNIGPNRKASRKCRREEVVMA